MQPQPPASYSLTPSISLRGSVGTFWLEHALSSRRRAKERYLNCCRLHLSFLSSLMQLQAYLAHIERERKSLLLAVHTAGYINDGSLSLSLSLSSTRRASDTRHLNCLPLSEYSLLVVYSITTRFSRCNGYIPMGCV